MNSNILPALMTREDDTPRDDVRCHIALRMSMHFEVGAISPDDQTPWLTTHKLLNGPNMIEQWTWIQVHCPHVVERLIRRDGITTAVVEFTEPEQASAYWKRWG